MTLFCLKCEGSNVVIAGVWGECEVLVACQECKHLAEMRLAFDIGDVDDSPRLLNDLDPDGGAGA